jgi:phosphoribosylamine--glycine ligase
MRIDIASSFGCGLSWWKRLADEGHDVRVWIEPSSHRTIGDGMVPKCTKADIEASSADLVLFDSSGLGDLADIVRKRGVRVVGGGSFCDKLEKDRSFGAKIAEEAGAVLPPYEEFGAFSEALTRARALNGVATYFKSDRYLEGDATHGADDGGEMAEYLEGLCRRYGSHGRCILQAKIPGVPLSTARWWNGSTWVGPYEGTYENKKFMNDDIGPATGCSFNAVWFYDAERPRIAELLEWENLGEAFRKAEAPPGIYDINAIVAEDGQAYFLEWTPRLGYDSEMTALALMPDLGAWLYAVGYGTEMPEWSDDIAFAVRLSVPPYPWEHAKKAEKGSADGIGLSNLPERGFVPYCVREGAYGMELAGPEGIVGLVCATGEDVSELGEEVLEMAKGIRVSGSALQYRSDGADDTIKMMEQLAEAGLDVPAGVLV